MKRLEELIERIEAGETPLQADVDRAATLVALDLVVQGDQFARESLDRHAAADGAIGTPANG